MHIEIDSPFRLSYTPSFHAFEMIGQPFSPYNCTDSYFFLNKAFQLGLGSEFCIVPVLFYLPKWRTFSCKMKNSFRFRSFFSLMNYPLFLRVFFFSEDDAYMAENISQLHPDLRISASLETFKKQNFGHRNIENKRY